MIRRQLLILLACVYVSSGYAQGLPLIPVCVSGIKSVCGLMDTNNRWRVTPRYQHIQFAGDVWIAGGESSDKRNDILNSQGEKIASLYSAYKVGDNILAAGQDKSSQVGLYRYDGTSISPLRFRWVKLFSEGLAGAQDDKTGKWGYIDIHGKWVITPQFEDADAFQDGLATVKTQKMKRNFPENMAINKVGKIIMPYRPGYSYSRINDQYWQATHSIYDPNNQFDIIEDKSDIINHRNSVVKKDINIIKLPENDVAMYSQQRQGKTIYGIINTRTLKTIVPAGTRDWQQGDSFTDGVATVLTPEGRRYIDTQGNNVAIDKSPTMKLAANLGASVTPALAGKNTILTNPWGGDGGINAYGGNNGYIEDLQALPPLMWLTGSDSASHDRVLIDTQGHWQLRIQEVSHIGNTQCGHNISLILNVKNEVIWPESPGALCEATIPNLKKYQPAALQILLAQEEIDREEELTNEKTDTLPWQQGPAVIPLSDVATFTLPAGYRYLPAQYVNALTSRDAQLVGDGKNSGDTRSIGFISPDKGWWRAAVRLDRHNTLDIHPLTQMKADELLEQLRLHLPEYDSSTKSAMSLKWDVPPQWDAATQRLSWGVTVKGINESDTLSKSVKIGQQWLVQLIPVSAGDFRYPQHARPEVVIHELNQLQDAIQFSEGQAYQRDNAGGTDATQLITGAPTKQEIAMQNHIVDENKQREEQQNQTLMRGLLHILPLLLLALGVGVVRKRRNKRP